MSFFFVIGMIAISITIFIPIFRKDGYELDKKSIPLYRMILDENGMEIPQKDPCPDC